MTKFIFLLTILIGGFASANLPPTSTLGSGDSSYVTTFKFNFGAIPLSHDGTTATVLTIPVSGGGTGVTGLTLGSVLFAGDNQISQDNSRFFWDSTNKRLGINQGSSTPTAVLDVHQSGNTVPMIQANNIGSQSSTGGALIQVMSLPSGATTSNASRLGAFQFGGAYNTSGDTAIGAAISGVATQAWSASANGTALNFNVTANNTTSRSTAITISQDRSVALTGTLQVSSDATLQNKLTVAGFTGIGTTSPNSALNVRLGALFSGDTSTIATKLGVTTGTSTSAVGVGAYTGGYPMVQGMAFDTTTGSTLLLNPAAGKVGAGAASGLGTPANDMTVSSGLSVGSSYWTTAAPSNGAIIQGRVGIGFTAPGVPLAFEDTKSTKVQFNGNNSNGYQIAIADALAGGDALYKFHAGVVAPGEFGFYSGGTPKMFISSTGSVGVGTTAPIAKLFAESTSSSLLGLYNTTAGGTVDLSFYGLNGAGNTNTVGIITLGNESSANASSYMSFSTRQSGGTTAEAMRITADQKIGISTTSPSYALDVSGDISATSSVRVGSTTYLTPSLGVTAGGAVYTDGSKLMTTAAGTAGQVLTSNGSSAPTWQSAGTAVAGSVVQTVTAVYSTATSSTSTTLIDTGLTASITPQSSSNKILVIVNQAGIYTSVSAMKGDLRLQRNGTDISVFFSGGYTTSGGETLWGGNAGTSYLDSPATTSSVTYKTQMRRVSGSGTFTVQNDSINSSITLMEIKQ